MNVKGFFGFKPHLPFRFSAAIYLYGEDEKQAELYQFAVSSISVTGVEADISAGATYFGDSFFTLPIFNTSSRTLNITFEETDDLLISRLFARVMDLNFHGLPYLVGVGITEYAKDIQSKIRNKMYYCYLKSYSEPQFSRTGNPGVVTVDCTFQVMSERLWDGKAVNRNEFGKMQDTTPQEDLSAIESYGKKVDPEKQTSFVPSEWKANFDASKAAYANNAKDSGTGGSGEGGGTGSKRGTPPGKKLEATGGIGTVTRDKIKSLATAEFTGKNGAGRKEGDADLVYLNSYDGGSQKGNFGMGNTQKYLEGQGMKDTQLTIVNTVTGKKYTGTMEQLTEILKKEGGAEGAKSVWRMDKASTAKVEECSMGHIADRMVKSVDKDILGAMDAGTIGGLAHIEYGAGGSLTAIGSYMNKHKEEALADLKKNNGQFSEEFVNKMMAEDKAVAKVMYREWTIKEGKHKGETMSVDRTGRLTGRSGHTMKRVK